MLRSLIWKILDVYSTSAYNAYLSTHRYLLCVQRLDKSLETTHLNVEETKAGQLSISSGCQVPGYSNTSHYSRGLALFPPQPALAFWKLSESWGRQFSFVLLQQPLTRPTHVANSLSVQDNFVLKRDRDNINKLSFQDVDELLI